eukprot:c33067_g1_i1.p1 GENE.c33067_g1_i1~~c33067_g1_i1.p1  ORF type:complete len:236 (-),score=46.28 c33067_g1_i1:29-712(-)
MVKLGFVLFGLSVVFMMQAPEAGITLEDFIPEDTVTLQGHVQIPGFLERFTLAPVEHDGKATWDFVDNDPNAKPLFETKVDRSIVRAATILQPVATPVTSTEAQSSHFSDLSNTKLEDKWYRRAGDDFDVSVEEWVGLNPLVQAQFSLISADEAGSPQKDRQSDNSPSGAESDISNQPLQFGKWYHKVGESFDINDEEFKSLPSDQKDRFVLVQTHEDFIRVQEKKV